MIENRPLLVVIILSMGIILANIEYASSIREDNKLTAEQLRSKYSHTILDYQGLKKIIFLEDGWYVDEETGWVVYKGSHEAANKSTGALDKPSYKIIFELDADYAISSVKFYKNGKIVDFIPSDFWTNQAEKRLAGWLKK